MNKALEMFLFCARGQFFYDGNKRLATLIANKIMIQNGLGIISIPIKYKNKFLQLLVEFYETNENSAIKNFIYDNCIDGISFSQNQDIKKSADEVAMEKFPKTEAIIKDNNAYKEEDANEFFQEE